LSYPEINQFEVEAVLRVLQSRRLSAGEEIDRFETLLAEYLGVNHVVSVSNATAGIELSLAANESVKPGSEVLLPAFTFPACINSVVARGLKPVLVDVERDTLNINPMSIEKNISKRTSALIPVDAFGVPYNHGLVQQIADKFKIQIIEDAACALGSSENGSKIGNSNHATVFSFHQRKIITTGEGGAIATNSENLASKLKLLRSHGASKGDFYASFVETGFNYRFNEMAASIGITQLEKLESNILAHASIAQKYNDLLENIDGVDITPAGAYPGRIYQSYIVRLASEEIRDSAINWLRSVGIETTIGTYDLSNQPAYQQFTKGVVFPEARAAGKTTLALPLFASLDDSQIDFITSNLIAFLKHNA
jgi:dTDP-4-amino-4,6-dideoxygalactose transaminase